MNSKRLRRNSKISLQPLNYFPENHLFQRIQVLKGHKSKNERTSFPYEIKKPSKVVDWKETSKISDSWNLVLLLSAKDKIISEEDWKCKSVLRVYNHNMKQPIVYNTSIAYQQRIKQLVWILLVSDYWLFSRDVTEAYLQSSKMLIIDIPQHH